MAINIVTEFGARATAADANYPFGSAKNRTTPETGTYLKKRLMDDQFGFFQKLLADAGITPSGNPDTVLASDYFDGLMAIMAPNLLHGLKIANSAVDTSYDIVINLGRAMDSTKTKIMSLPATITKRIDAVWAAGTNQGGRRISTLSEDTYGVFLIMHTNGTVDVGFDTSQIAINLLSDTGYTYYRRIGWVVTRPTPFIISPFVQSGNIFHLKNPIESTTYSINTAAQTVNLPAIPSKGIKSVQVLAEHWSTVITASTYKGIVGNTAVNPDTYHNLLQLAGQPANVIIPVSLDIHTIDNQVDVDWGNTSATSLYKLTGLGWVDQRGQDGDA